MSTHGNKETVRRLYDITNSGDLDELDRYISSDLMDHTASLGRGHGLEGLKNHLRQFRSAFSDIRAEIHDQVAEGDKVVSRLTFHAKHTGEFQGIPPTGKEVSLPGIEIVRLSGGKIVERWGIGDYLGLLTQLGAIPETGEPGRRAA